jgi:uncharacterized damage-inducible protein DinB
MERGLGGEDTKRTQNIRMRASEIQELIAYNYALYRRLWESIDRLTDEQYIEPIAYSYGSIRNHMVHLMSNDERWLATATSQPLPDHLRPEAFPNRAVTREKWDSVESMVLTAVQQMDDAAVARELDIPARRRPGGERVPFPTTVWRILMHVVNHGTEHRVQLLRMLYDFGAPTFEQDYMIYLINEWQAAE